jgi:hypothetical protein
MILLLLVQWWLLIAPSAALVVIGCRPAIANATVAIVFDLEATSVVVQAKEVIAKQSP